MLFNGWFTKMDIVMVIIGSTITTIGVIALKIIKSREVSNGREN